MAKAITSKKLAKNVIISLIAQLISLLVSFLLNLIVPKFISESAYGYWQSYVLYSGYATLFHFGMLDGLILRYSAYDYDELDKRRMRSQFTVLLVLVSLCAAITAITSFFVFTDEYRIVFVIAAVSIILKNLTLYNSYVYQMTNRINKYALLIIIQRGVYGIVVVLLLICGVKDFYWFCIAEAIGDAVAFIIGVVLNGGKVYLGKILSFKETFKEFGANAGAGIIVMLANFSSAFIVSGAKMVVQWHWDEELFGKVALAFSLTNVFLNFITAVSVVLFPSLKRLDESKLPEMYKKIRDILSPLMFFAMLAYFPGCWILNKWLPNYSPSLGYLALLLPLIIYSSKMNLLTNNYLKVYRKEKLMLVINAAAAAVGLVSFLLCAYAFNSIEALLLCAMGTIMLCSIASEIAVMKLIGVKFYKDYIFELLLTIGFILVAYNLSLLWGFIAYLAMFAVYAAVNYKTVIALVKGVTSRFKRKPADVTSENNTDVNTDENIENVQSVDTDKTFDTDITTENAEISENTDSADETPNHGDGFED